MKLQFKPIPSQEFLKSIFIYDPQTGTLFKKLSGVALKKVGCKRYRRGGKPWLILIGCNKTQYPAHRIIWRMVTGDDPGVLTIDHIDRNPHNNKWENLRLADCFLQSRNREWEKTKGNKGVSFHKATQKWQVRKTKGDKRVYLGVYETKQEAINALQEYEKTQRSSN